MNKFLIAIASSILIVACNSAPTTKAETEQSKKEVSIDFLKDLKSLKDVEDPINTFVSGAESIAVNKEEFTKSNAKELLNNASAFAHAVIVVEDHTIVLLSNIDDCQQSLSWDACMPKGEGYIKKGDLEYHDDYINNIIGQPDNSKRIIYFFAQ